jgi:hypothetical protein
MTALSASPRQHGRGLVQHHDNGEFLKIGPFGAGTARSAGGAGYFLGDTKIKIQDLDPASMFLIRAFAIDTFNFHIASIIDTAPD